MLMSISAFWILQATRVSVSALIELYSADSSGISILSVKTITSLVPNWPLRVVVVVIVAGRFVFVDIGADGFRTTGSAG